MPIPEGIVFVGYDSGVRHAVTGAAYGDVRCAGAFMGYRMIADFEKLRVGAPREDGSVQVEWTPRWGGYLANIEPPEFEENRTLRRCPKKTGGAEFIARYGSTTDPVTRVRSEKKYAVRTPTAHPIYEHLSRSRLCRTFARRSRAFAPSAARRTHVSIARELLRMWTRRSTD